MESKIEVFKNEKFGEIRAASINGNPYFAGKDAAVMLGYDDANDAIARHVDVEDKVVVQLSDAQEDAFGVPSPGHAGGSRIGLVGESGLYSLILGSSLPGAEEFGKWIASEVIPILREKGAYAALTTERMELALKEMGERLREIAKNRQVAGELKEQPDAETSTDTSRRVVLGFLAGRGKQEVGEKRVNLR
jgi:prophage antirepressor-like protein